MHILLYEWSMNGLITFNHPIMYERIFSGQLNMHRDGLLIHKPIFCIWANRGKSEHVQKVACFLFWNLDNTRERWDTNKLFLRQAIMVPVQKDFNALCRSIPSPRKPFKTWQRIWAPLVAWSWLVIITLLFQMCPTFA